MYLTDKSSTMNLRKETIPFVNVSQLRLFPHYNYAMIQSWAVPCGIINVMLTSASLGCKICGLVYIYKDDV